MTPKTKTIENETITEELLNSALTSTEMTSSRGSLLENKDSRLKSPSPEESPAITASATPQKTLSLATSTISNSSTSHTNTFFQPPIPARLENALVTLINRVIPKNQLHETIKNALINFAQKQEYVCGLKDYIRSKYDNQTKISLAINYDTNAKEGTADRLFIVINEHPVYEISLEQPSNTYFQPK